MFEYLPWLIYFSGAIFTLILVRINWIAQINNAGDFKELNSYMSSISKKIGTKIMLLMNIPIRFACLSFFLWISLQSGLYLLGLASLGFAFIVIAGDTIWSLNQLRLTIP